MGYGFSGYGYGVYVSNGQPGLWRYQGQASDPGAGNGNQIMNPSAPGMISGNTSSGGDITFGYNQNGLSIGNWNSTGFFGTVGMAVSNPPGTYGWVPPNGYPYANSDPNISASGNSFGDGGMVPIPPPGGQGIDNGIYAAPFPNQYGNQGIDNGIYANPFPIPGYHQKMLSPTPPQQPPKAPGPKDLFPTGNFQQGQIGDCYFLSTVKSVMDSPGHGKAALENMILKDGDQGYKVTFPGYPQDPIHVDVSELDNDKQVKGDLGFRVLEMAFAKLNSKEHLVGKKDEPDLSPTLGNINDGGNPDVAMKVLTGQDGSQLMKGPLGWLNGVLKHLDFNSFSGKVDETLDKMRKDSGQHIVTVGTIDSPLDKNKFPGNHAFSLEMEANGDLTLINPWNSSERIKTTPEELKNNFGDIEMMDNPQVLV